MIVFPNCKINLGLSILGKRSDGYHNLETVLYPIGICDALEIIGQNLPRQNSHTDIQFTTSGLNISETYEGNLCVVAYRLLKKDFPLLPPISIHIHKAIPIGAGLGGGSSDGAFMLTLLNQKFQLQLSTKQLLDYALKLGSDAPFFIINKPSLATGRGELLKSVPVDLTGFKLVVVNPGIRLSTAEGFSSVHATAHSKSILDIIAAPVDKWREELVNDFEIAIFEVYPEIAMVKETLYNAGAIYASMSGSGSSVYGIFPEDDPLAISFPAGYFVKELAG